MKAPGLNQETVHGNTGLEKFLASSLAYSQNLSMGYIKGDKWYVDKGVAGSGDGTSWEKAFKTITESIAVAGDDDRVIVAPGQYDEEPATLAITQNNFKLLALETGPNKALTRTEIRMHGVSDTDVISVNSHNVEIAGFRITPYDSTTSCGITVASDAETYGVYIHDNYFYAPAATNTRPLVLGDGGTYNADSAAIINNEFWKGGGASIYQIEIGQSNKCLIAGNTFTQIGSGQYSLKLSDNGAENSKILNNVWWAAESGAKAIWTPATLVAGDYCIDGNHFVNYSSADAILDPADEAVGLNYYNESVITTN